MSLPALVNPVGADFLKDWPFQNEENCDNIDAYAGACLFNQGMQPYTPSLRGASSNPVLGTGGFNRGYYYRIFDQVWVYGILRFGTSGTSFGSGVYYVGLPFEMHSFLKEQVTPAWGYVLGQGYIDDNSTPGNNQPLTVQLATTTEVQFQVKMTSGASGPIVSPTVPFTLANQDAILWSARYVKESL